MYEYVHENGIIFGDIFVGKLLNLTMNQFISNAQFTVHAWCLDGKRYVAGYKCTFECAVYYLSFKRNDK